MRRLETIHDRIKKREKFSFIVSKPNLAIIITGQLRCFFTKTEPHFTQLLDTSKNIFNILVIVVLSSHEQNLLENYFTLQNISFTIINYSTKKYLDEFNTINSNKIKSEKYMEIKSNYLKSDNQAKNEILDIDYNLTKISRQFHQLQIGISKLLEFESTHKITFDILMKTRFDVYYPPNFYPHVFDESECLLKKLLFNDTNIDLFQSCMQTNNIQNLEELSVFIKQQEIKLPKCRINFDYINMTFGGWNYYNYTALDNILHGNNDILYSFNDFFYFAKRSVFLKLKDFFKECFLLEPNGTLGPLHHIYAPESQLIMYCLEKNINIVMYDDGSKDYSGSFGLVR